MGDSKKFKPKKLKDQVIVITGASSGIGLATALLAAKKGARLVLASRNEPDLSRIRDDVQANGGQAVYEVADVSNRESIERIAEKAVEAYGGFDTWVNNAAGTIMGKLTEVRIEDERRLFDVNYWSVVYGSLTALKHLRQKGGTIINIGSVLSNRAIPLQGTYVATKHAVKAFSDALRMELEKEDAPVSITLIKPATIDTPYPHHARSYLSEKVTLPPPYYAPEVVARAILSCAERPHRDIAVGGAAAALIWMEKLIPRTTDRLMRLVMFRAQKNPKASKIDEDGLYSAPASEGRIRGGYPGHVARTSLYTAMRLHPWRVLLVSAAAVGAARSRLR